MSLPLSGVTVVAAEQAVAAPFASRQLADLGARVIKIERRDGGDFARQYDSVVQGMSSAFAWLNRSKESVVLDLKHPRAAEVLTPLLAGADVFLQNLAPGAVGRLGLDAASLAVSHPNLIVCDVSGYGDGGPYQQAKAYDLLAQGETGLISITGTPESPAKAGLSIADIAAGMYAFSGVLAALLDRERTGAVRRVPVSLFGSLGEWMGYPMYYAMYGGSEPRRRGARHGTIAPYGSFDTADGTVLIAVQNQREWHRFCAQVLGDAGLADDPRFATNSERTANSAALDDIIQLRLSIVDTVQVQERLAAAGIANGRLNTMAEFAAHPQHEGRWTTVGSSVGAVQALPPPGVPDGLEPRMGPIPDLGQHTRSVLRELDFTEQQISELEEERLVWAGEANT